MTTHVPSGGSLRIVVGIATANRCKVLEEVLPVLATQTRAPDRVIVCAPKSADIPFVALAALGGPTQTLLSPPGLCAQRNAILHAVPDADILLFLDDDFLMAPDYLLAMERLFLTHPEVVMCTGQVAADGILGPGFSPGDGVRMLGQIPPAPGPADDAVTPIYNAYGCNMGIRLAPVRALGARFDENLPLYGWLEDVDFSRQIARAGKIVRVAELRGIHLGTKFGRSPGHRLGYSQVANPVYLMRKKTMSPRHAMVQIGRNLIANTVKILRPEPWVDRRGRLRGNLAAIADLLLGRSSPTNILRLD